ncbi:MAG: DNA alkylation repair protein [Candidatus Bilamarchaeaceae archaeon]
MPKELLEIKKILQTKANEKVKASFQKFIPTSQKVYGVKIPELNSLAIKYKTAGFGLVEELWQSESFEEKLLATKLLGKLCKQDPEKTLKLIKKFAKEIVDWAVCDTLATQGIKGIVKTKQKEIFGISKKLVKSKNFWERRFAIVLLINFTKDKSLTNEIREIIKNVESDKEYYVQKAVEWVKRKLE